jgi:hypothetical protein
MAHFQSQNCLIKTPTEVKKLEGVSFCPLQILQFCELGQTDHRHHTQSASYCSRHRTSSKHFLSTGKECVSCQCPFQGPLRIPAIQCGFTMQKPLHIPLNGSEAFVTILSHCKSRIELPPKLLSKLLGCCHRKPFLHSLECSI